MQRLNDVVANQTGAPVSYAQITVTSYPSNAPVTVYSDNGITPITQPIVADRVGNYFFYAADGRYNRTISASNFTTYTVFDTLLEDPANASSQVINGGSIDGTTIGATTQSTGNFSTLAVGGTDISSGYIIKVASPINSIAILGTSRESLLIDSTYWSSKCSFLHANWQMGAPFHTFGSFGVGGDTSGPQGANPGFTSRVASIISSGAYGWCWVGFPINDITNGGGATVSFTINNLTTIYRQLLNAGIKVITSTGYPSTFILNGSSRDKYAQVQNFIKEFCAQNPHMILCNEYLAMADPNASDMRCLTNATLDGVHATSLGAALSGACIAESFGNGTSSALVKPLDRTIENIYDPRNYAPNPFLSGAVASGAGGAYAGTGITTSSALPNSIYFRRGATGGNTGSAVITRAPARSSLWKQPNAGIRIAVTGVATNDSVAMTVGGDANPGSVNVGRMNLTALINTSYVLGQSVIPSGGNGFFYTCIVAGTSAGSAPTWSTQEGEFVTDGSVVWLTKLLPVMGDQFYAEAEIETSSLVGSGIIVLQIGASDTTGIGREQQVSNFFNYGAGDILPTIMPSKMIIRTQPITLGSLGTNYTPRYITGVLSFYAGSASSYNADVMRIAVKRIMNLTGNSNSTMNS